MLLCFLYLVSAVNHSRLCGVIPGATANGQGVVLMHGATRMNLQQVVVLCCRGRYRTDGCCREELVAALLSAAQEQACQEAGRTAGAGAEKDPGQAHPQRGIRLHGRAQGVCTSPVYVLSALRKRITAGVGSITLPLCESPVLFSQGAGL